MKMGQINFGYPVDKIDALKSLAKVARNAAKGKVMVSPRCAADRLNTCLKCDSFDKEIMVCKECGCFMIVKVILKDMECKKKLWQ